MKNKTLTLLLLVISSIIYAQEQSTSKEIYTYAQGQSISIIEKKDNNFIDTYVLYKAKNQNNKTYRYGDEYVTMFEGSPVEFYSYITQCIDLFKIKNPKSIDKEIEGNKITFDNFNSKFLILWGKEENRYFTPHLSDLKSVLKAFTKWADNNKLKYK